MEPDTSQCIQAFLRAKASAKRSPKTLERYHSQLQRFATVHNQLPTDPVSLDRFLSGIEGEPETRDTYYRTLSSFYSWLVRRRIVKENPMISVDAPVLRQKIPRLLQPDELYRLLTHEAHPDRERALLFFLADSGARIGEAAGLRVEDLRDGFVILGGKTGQRFAPLSNKVRQMVLELPRGRSSFAWIGRCGPLGQSALVHLVIAAFRRAGFIGRRYSAHALRHTFGTMWEGDEIVLQQILGHKKLAMVQRYRQYRLGRAIRQHEVYSPLSQLGLFDLNGHRKWS